MSTPSVAAHYRARPASGGVVLSTEQVPVWERRE